MCDTCGCGQPGHSHDHPHEKELVQLHEDVMIHNNEYAQTNRQFFSDRRILTLNLLSSPGSGKTTLVERTIKAIDGQYPVAVIEGDQQTELDAERIRRTGAPALQINTGAGCHLDAHQIHHALDDLQPVNQSLLIIENVGNLVCPSMFDLGEHHKVVVLSVTEGEDKPIKYPHMFHAADVVVYNKIDLLPYVDFDISKSQEYARQLNDKILFFELSAATGEGLPSWLEWLDRQVTADHSG